jgi:hypothetical protein
VRLFRSNLAALLSDPPSQETDSAISFVTILDGDGGSVGVISNKCTSVAERIDTAACCDDFNPEESVVKYCITIRGYAIGIMNGAWFLL